MNVYIFHDLDQVSAEYHRGGGLVVIARDMEHVRELIAGYTDIRIDPDEERSAIILPLARTVKEPGVYVFPDSGCC